MKKARGPSRKWRRLLRRNLPLLASLVWLTIAAWHVCYHGTTPWQQTLVVVGWSTWLASIASILLYAYDKMAAQRGTGRIAESTLHAVSLVGGWPGATLAQSLFRHKCLKTEFLQLHAMAVVSYFVVLVALTRR